MEGKRLPAHPSVFLLEKNILLRCLQRVPVAVHGLQIDKRGLFLFFMLKQSQIYRKDANPVPRIIFVLNYLQVSCQWQAPLPLHAVFPINGDILRHNHS